MDLVLGTGVALKPGGRRAASGWEGSPLKKEHGRLERAGGNLRGIGKGTSWLKMQTGSAEQGGEPFAWCVCVSARGRRGRTPGDSWLMAWERIITPISC